MQGEYRGDFTRDTFDPLKRFSRVLMQQGRVQLDADWNEQTSILLHYMRSLAADLIGPHGGPAKSDGQPGEGFNISQSDGDGSMMIGKGHYYVDGILCENDVDNLTYTGQPGYPFPNSIVKGVANSSYLVFLDVWERHVTYVEDDSLREVALGGPDTASRAQVVCQVKVPLLAEAQGELQGLVDGFTNALSAADKKTALQNIDIFAADQATFFAQSKSQMRARARHRETSLEPCGIPPESKFRGAENQLYRVEIHRTGLAWNGVKDQKEGNPSGNAKTAATFKWSRDNGCVIFPILMLSGEMATLANLGRDASLSLRENDWVEIVDDTLALQGRSGPLLQIAKIDRDEMSVTFKPHDGPDLPQYDHNDSKHPLLRRWDHRDAGNNLSDGAVLILEGDGEQENYWLQLEDGVEIQFPKLNVNSYRAGDYWLVPARIATGDVIWPMEKNADNNLVAGSLPPHGIDHHVAPLAVISLNAQNQTTVIDLRRTIRRLALPI
ncbi:MAG: DUF6519 domain-containing protein [Pirellulaceae bacterium]